MVGVESPRHFPDHLDIKHHHTHHSALARFERRKIRSLVYVNALIARQVQ
jgi:hypothetical protein